MITRRSLIATVTAASLLAAACGSDDGDADTTDDAEATEVDSSASEPAEEPADASASEPAEEPAEASASEPAEEPAEEPAPAEGDVLRVALTFAPDSGLAIESDDASTLVKAGVIEGLVRSDASGQPTPALAESWERIDPTTWEFTLRSDVVFHDGTTFSANAVAIAIDYISNVAAPPRSLGGLALTTEIVDDATIRIITSDPDPILPLRMSSRSMGILAPAAYESEPTAPIGTGPFALTDFTPPDSLTVERNDNYWGETAQLAGAEFRFIPDARARATAIRADEVDVADGIPIAELGAIEDDDSIDLIRFDLPRTASLYSNTQTGPMSDPDLRRAVSLAVDNDALADDLLEGQFAAARDYFGAENSWAPSDLPPEDAVEQARALVEAADPADRSISIWTYTGRDELADMATVAQAQLQEVGFDVSVEVGEYTPLEERTFAGEHDLFLGSRGYYFDIADAGALYTSDFTCEGGYNLNLFCDPEFDALIAQLAEVDSTDARQEIFAEAAVYLQERFVGIPLVHDRARYAVRDDVEGLVIDPFELILLTPDVALS
ncbi:MAG: ABC transporter substrate-binding protein [Actinomycetota bacterium]